MIQDKIKVATIKGYEGPYATIVLREGEGIFDEPDRTIEEVMLQLDNSMSQNLPDIGSDVLVAFDSTGECHLLKVIGSEYQAPPALGDPSTVISSNGKMTVTKDADGGLTAANAIVEAKLTDDGKVSVTKGILELITILSDTLNYIATSTCPSGSPLTNAAQIAAEKLKLDKFKV